MYASARRALTAALVCPLAVGAQSVGANATVASAYVWRGVTLTNASVVQPKVSFSLSGQAGTLTAFAAGNVEPTSASAPNAIRQGGQHTGLNELDLVAQFTAPVGRTSLTAGWIAYRFSEQSTSISDIYNTQEGYVGVRLDSAFATPSITAYLDVEKVHGVYLEGSASRSVKVGRVPTTLSVMAGWSQGQEQRGDADVFYNFARRGLTHVDVGVATGLTFAGLTLTPSAHLQLSPTGQNTRVTGALDRHKDHASRVWVAFDIGWAR